VQLPIKRDPHPLTRENPIREEMTEKEETREAVTRSTPKTERILSASMPKHQAEASLRKEASKRETPSSKGKRISRMLPLIRNKKLERDSK
jgi:hypothetical protein